MSLGRGDGINAHDDAVPAVVTAPACGRRRKYEAKPIRAPIGPTPERVGSQASPTTLADDLPRLSD
jgi:hypothetical protein